MTLDLDHLSKLAGAAAEGLDGDWYAPKSIRYAFHQDARLMSALDPATVQELIRLARLGMEREAD